MLSLKFLRSQFITKSENKKEYRKKQINIAKNKQTSKQTKSIASPIYFWVRIRTTCKIREQCYGKATEKKKNGKNNNITKAF